jgi:Tol biopolymer transport system component
MKRLLAALVPAGLLLSACAVGDPKPTTYVSDTGAVLNGDVYSSLVGETKYWFKYGTTTTYGSATAQRTVDVEDTSAHPVSAPISGLSAATTYHFQMCVQDAEEEPPRDICSTDRTFTTGPAGGRSGITFMSTRDADNEIYVMDAGGENETRLTEVAGLDQSPAWSPDGRKIVFASSREDNFTPELWVMDADGSNQTKLKDAAAFDADPAWSPLGDKIAYYGSNQIKLVDVDGENDVFLTEAAGDSSNPAWSPDGRRIAFAASRAGSNDIWVMNADGSDETQLTTDASYDVGPTWSPDGQRIAFWSDRDGDYEVWTMDADGSDQEPITDDDNWDRLPTWSLHSDLIAFGSLRDGPEKIFVMPPNGSDPVPLTDTQGDTEAAWSPRP